MKNHYSLGKADSAWQRIIVIVLLMTLAVIGSWAYQQNTINKQNAKISDLEKQVDMLSNNDSLSHSISGELEEVTLAARDTERQTDVKAVHGQVEAYYAQNGRYPTLANLNDSAFRTANLKGLDPEALYDPKGDKTDTTPMAGSAGTNVYSYAATPSGCDNSTTDCSGYALTATLEGGGTYVKNSLN